VRWCRFKNSRELFDGYKHKILLEYVETGVLEGDLSDDGDARPELNVVCQMMVNSVISDDCGEVECRAFNSGGIDSTRAQLHMKCTSHSYHAQLLVTHRQTGWMQISKLRLRIKTNPIT